MENGRLERVVENKRLE